MQARCSTLLAVLFAGVACARSPEPCASAGTCPEGQECLANRCVVAGGEPVSPDSLRRVAEPTRMAVVSAHTRKVARELPPSIAFGSARDGDTALYLTFPPIWRGAKQVEAAFLVLEPMAGTLPSSRDVEVRAWRVRGRWQADDLSFVKQPETAPPAGAGIARGAPPSPLRIDVTSIVEYLHEHPHSDFGIVLKSSDEAAGGVSFATGTSGGRAPRLEVYLR